ncbi:MAG: NAD+ synthase [Proteobacteria bacterium]|nr:NAD+ synthase [Pseudomonadota bacterium]MCZ6783908.1 NAD+ synthase [Pseudomonadota bacterium]
MKIGIAQVNPTVGDLAGNRRLVEEAAAKAAEEGADLVVLPEMVLTGYPPMDLLERDGFVRDQMRELEALRPASKRVAIVLGAVLPWPEGRPKKLANAAVLLAGGEQVAAHPKSLLPTYDVFDENRYFAPAERREPVTLPGSGAALGLTVCEDTWVDTKSYDVDPTEELVAAGASLILNPSCSPWHVDRPRQRRLMLSELARRHRVPIVFVNQVGGNDELVFDGASFVTDANGRIRASLPLFEPGFAVVDLAAVGPGLEPDAVLEPEPVAQLQAGLVLGIRDYFGKQNLPPGAVVGLSGGIDSSVTAHLAVEALGPDQVVGVAMPGPFSSEHSIADALALGRNLGIEVRRVDIAPMYSAYRDAFAALFGEREDYGLTQQNIQSRIRGAIVMAVSNEEHRLVLATGNKSELSVGYCTLYGDTVGGLGVLGDVYKRDVYALARYANRDRERIPANTIDKPPSAELAPDQLDSDDLPEYDVLDAVLQQAIEEGRSAASIEPPPGCDPETAAAVVARLDRNEFKRRQTPLVLRTSPKAFGTGRRLPIVHRYF